MRLACLLLPVVALVAPVRGAGAQAPPWAAAVDSMMRSEMAGAQVPGAQIAIAQNGRLVYTRGYGVADVETGRPVTERTLFQVGSVTKAVTGAVLAQLAAEGAVELQAPISRYVPELAGRRVGTATVHQLLSMSAGWADFARPFGTTDEAAMGRTLPALADTMILLEPGRIYAGTGATTVEVRETVGRLEWRGTRNTFPLRVVSANRLVAEPPGQPPRQVYVIRDADGRVRYLFAINAAYVKQP